MDRILKITTILYVNILMTAKTAYAGSWEGVDKTVIEHYAVQSGRAPTRSLIPIEGDVLLLAFLCAGVVGGFVLGYFWRKLFQ